MSQYKPYILRAADDVAPMVTFFSAVTRHYAGQCKLYLGGNATRLLAIIAMMLLLLQLLPVYPFLAPLRQSIAWLLLRNNCIV